MLAPLAGKETITASQVAAEPGLIERMTRNLLKDWVDDGWLEVKNPSRPAYSLSAIYRQPIFLARSGSQSRR